MGMGVLILLATVVAGQGDPTTGISESAFLNTVDRDERVRVVLDEPVAIARAERARAGTFSNPDAAFEREDVGDLPRQDTWSLSWAPPIDGRLWVADRAARAGLSAAENRQELAHLALRTELRETFSTWVLAHEGATIGERLAALVDRLSRQANEQASRGEVSLLAARRLSLARIEVRAEAARLSAELAYAQARVRVWLPELSADAVPLRPPLPPVPADTSSWAQSPRLEALAHDMEQAEALSSHAGRFWALPELSIGYQTQRGDLVDLEGPVFGVRWGLPLFDRRQGDRTMASARLSATRARMELDEARVREEFMAALVAYATLRAAAALAIDSEQTAERVIASATEMFEAGESDVTDLLETLRGALAGHLAVIGSYADALRAHRDLEMAAGRPLPLAEGGEQ